MTTTRQDISDWFDDGKEQNADFMIVVCDTFDWEDYPVYCTNNNFEQKYKNCSRNMQKVMEVYDLSLDKESQLSEYRANHPPKSS